jgi:hypothetical protein
VRSAKLRRRARVSRRLSEAFGCLVTNTMKLRAELMPPTLDQAKVRRLTKLAARLDGRRPRLEYDLATVNSLAGTAFAMLVGDPTVSIHETKGFVSKG